jgi:ABC-2 type transport system permease protein
MAVFFSNIKRILRKRTNRILIFLLPVLFVIIAFNINTTSGTVSVGVVDNDNTEFTRGIKTEVECEFIKLNDEEIKSAIATGADYIVVIDKGFTDKIIKGQDAQIKSYKPDGLGINSGARLAIENYINAGKNIAQYTNKDSNKFYELIKEYKKGNFSSEVKVFNNEKGSIENEKYSLGFLAYTLLLLASISCYIIMEDKKNNTLVRIYATPISSKSYLLQNIFSFLVIMIVQIIIMFNVITKGFKGDIGPSFFNMFILFTVFAVCSIALNLAICSVSKNAKQASTLSGLINTLLAMLGGCFWPREIMPNMLKTAGDFTPTAWLIDAVNKLLLSSDISSVYKNIGIILLFTVVFFLFCSWKKVDIETI